MMQDVLAPSASVDAILVVHTSRFMREAGKSIVHKQALARRARLRQRLGCTVRVSGGAGLLRLGAEAAQARSQSGRAPAVAEVFQLYVAHGGAKAVARELNQRGRRFRRGRLWTKDFVLRVIEESAAIGTYYWRKTDSSAYVLETLQSPRPGDCRRNGLLRRKTDEPRHELKQQLADVERRMATSREALETHADSADVVLPRLREPTGPPRRTGRDTRQGGPAHVAAEPPVRRDDDRPLRQTIRDLFLGAIRRWPRTTFASWSSESTSVATS
jgi:hypothetical protein